MSTGTPWRQDKRLQLTAGVIAAVLALVAMGRPPNEQVLTFLGVVLTGFNVQSQAGQTARARAALATGKGSP